MTNRENLFYASFCSIWGIAIGALIITSEPVERWKAKREWKEIRKISYRPAVREEKVLSGFDSNDIPVKITQNFYDKDSNRVKTASYNLPSPRGNEMARDFFR
ncbi:MAG: hypothetical protein AABX85_03665 [Nanoarchaeota archaeon]